MAEKPRKLVDMKIHAVAGVDKAANKRKFLVVKRADDGFFARLSRLFKQEGAMTPKTFDQSLAGTKLDDTWWQLNDALRTSLRSIVESSVDNKAELIRESVAQYAERLIAIAGEAGATADATAMAKIHDALVAVADAADGGDPVAKVDDVEAVVKMWREQIEKGDGNMPDTQGTVDLDALLKDASEETREAVKAAFAKQAEAISSLEKQVEALSKKDGSDADPDDINKADLPEPVRKRLEDLEKKAKDAEKIAKAEREARVRSEIRKRAEGYANAGEVEKIAEAIYKAQGVSQEFAEQLEGLFQAAHERIAKGDLFREMGSGAGDGASTAWGKIEKAADEIQKANPSLTRAEAIAKAVENNPELETAYAEEVRQ